LLLFARSVELRENGSGMMSRSPMIGCRPLAAADAAAASCSSEQLCAFSAGMSAAFDELKAAIQDVATQI